MLANFAAVLQMCCFPHIMTPAVRMPPPPRQHAERWPPVSIFANHPCCALIYLPNPLTLDPAEGLGPPAPQPTTSSTFQPVENTTMEANLAFISVNPRLKYNRWSIRFISKLINMYETEDLPRLTKHSSKNKFPLYKN